MREILLFAAVKTRNQALLVGVEREKCMQICLDKGNIDVEKLAVEALKAAVVGRKEEFAIAIAALLTSPVPLCLVHRAGEAGFLLFLASLVRSKAQLRPNRVLSSVSERIKRLLPGHKHQNKMQRFPAKETYLTGKELLHWAVLAQGRQGIFTVLGMGLDIALEVVAEVVLKEGLGALLEEVLGDQWKRVPVDLLLKYEQFPLAIRILDSQRRNFTRKTPKHLKSYETMNRLISLISDPSASLSSIYLLSFISQSEWAPIEVKFLHQTLTDLLKPADVDKSMIANHLNPTFFCVVVCELAYKVADYTLQMSDKLKQVAVHYLRLAELIQGQYSDYKRLQGLYIEKAYGPLCLFDVITGNTDRYRSLLNSEIVAAIVQHLWTGGESVGVNFDYMALANEYLDQPIDALFSVHRTVRTLPKCIFQLYYWKNNGSLRFVVETLVLIGLYGILLSMEMLYLTIIPIIEDPMNHLSELPGALKRVITQNDLINVMTIFSSGLVLAIFQQFTYKRLLNEPYSFGFSEFLSVSLFVLLVQMSVTTREEIFMNMNLITLQNYQEHCFALIMFSISLRICSILTKTRTFGPWIRMIFIVTKSTLTFLVLFVLAVLSFATGFVYLFRRDGEYFGTIPLSIRTLFQWSVGGIDISIFTYREELGSILGILWAFVSTIILLNLLIAVLSARYEDLVPNITADYVSIMYQAYSQTRYTEPYGALIIAPAPFNFLTFPLLPLYLLCPKVALKLELDKWFVLVSYQVLFTAAVCLFACYNCLLSLFVYFHVSYELLSRQKFCKFPIWIVFSPAYLAYLAVLSSKAFVLEMYRTPSKDESSVLSPQILVPVRAFLICLTAHNPTPAPLTLTDIETLVATLPYSSYSVPTANSPEHPRQRQNKFRRVAERIYFSRSQLTNDIKRGIIELFALFQGYASEGKAAVIDILRMQRFLSASAEKLVSANVVGVQTAFALFLAEKA